MDTEIFELFENCNGLEAEFTELETENIFFDDSSYMQYEEMAELSEDGNLTAQELETDMSAAENIQETSAPATLGCCSNNSMKMKCFFCNGTGKGLGDFACNFCGGLGFK